MSLLHVAVRCSDGLSCCPVIHMMNREAHPWEAQVSEQRGTSYSEYFISVNKNSENSHVL